MATISPLWTVNQELRAPATLAGGASADHDLNLATLGFDLVSVQVSIVKGAASSINVAVYMSPDGGTTDDTLSIAAYTVTADEVRTFEIVGPHAQIRLTNNDGSNATGNIGVKYAGRKWQVT